jgi:hypothetical protein
MILSRTVVESSFLRKDGANLVFPNLFNQEISILLINPTIYSPEISQISSVAQLEAARTTFTSDLIVPASDYVNSNWSSNKWSNYDEDIQIFVESNFRYDANGFNRKTNWVLIQKTIDTVDYTVLFIYAGTQGDQSQTSFFSFNKGDGGGFSSISNTALGSKALFNKY